MFAGESGAIGGVLWRRGRAEFACRQVISAKEFKLSVVGTKSNRQYDDIARERYRESERDANENSHDDEPLLCLRF